MSRIEVLTLTALVVGGAAVVQWVARPVSLPTAMVAPTANTTETAPGPTEVATEPDVPVDLEVYEMLKAMRESWAPGNGEPPSNPR